MALRYSQGFSMANAGQIGTKGEIGTDFALVSGGASADTIVRTSGDFTAKFKMGDMLRILGATDSADDVETPIVSVAALTITLGTGIFTTGEAAGATIALVASDSGVSSDVYNGGSLVLYTGTRATKASDTIGTAAELAEFTDIVFSEAVWDTTNERVYIQATGLSATATASGTATWARLTALGDNATGDSTTAKRIDFSVGVSTGDIQLKSTTINTNDPIAISAFKLTLSLSL